MGEKSWLRISSQRQLVGWTIETQATEVSAESGIYFAKYSAGDGKRVCQILSHPRLL
jgi:hypothetical protein